MTVAELIDQLQKFDQDKEIRVSVEALEKDSLVVLECVEEWHDEVILYHE